MAEASGFANSQVFSSKISEGVGEPTVTFLLDPVGVLMELAHYVCDRVLSLVEAK